MIDEPRIICVSNRLPVSASKESSSLEFQPSSGGLVTAMGPILRKSRGVWIGWPGDTTSPEEDVRCALAKFSEQSDFDLFPVFMDTAAITGFYEGFSNQIVWPLFHDLQTRCNFEPSFWSAYLDVQALFAHEVLKNLRSQDLVWVHDYHLMGLGRELRRVGVKNRLCFFFHTPFPSPDIFLKLPWRSDVVESILKYDLIGFQTVRDLKNFVDCIQLVTDKGASSRGANFIYKQNGHECIIGCFPISIDFSEFEEISHLAEVEANAKKIREDMNVEHLILSIDRLDYTKGIPHRIKAFKRLLELEPSLSRKVALLQVVVPSRADVPEYKQLRLEIEQLVTQVNGALAEPGWVPVHHLFRTLTREEVVSMYRAANVAVVTPLKDGMNLVAKEYCASCVDDEGALVLSEFAGAASEFKGLAFLVNPYDIEGVALAINNARLVSKDDPESRMQKMRELVKKADVFTWASNFLAAAGWQWKSIDTVPKPASIWRRFWRITNVFDI